MRRFKGSGFTLIEVLVTSVIFVAIGLVVLALMLWGLDGSSSGQAQQLAQQDARTALEALRGDMAQSVIPPLGTSGTLLVPSGVLIPSSYQNIPAGDIYTQEVPSPVAPVTLQSINMVAFTVANKSASSFIPTLLSDPLGNPEFSLLVYYVTDSSGRDVTQFQAFDAQGNPVPTSARGMHGTVQPEGGHILWKNVYNVFALEPLINTGVGGLWAVDPTQLNGPNGQIANPGASPSDPVTQSQVVSLNSGDALQFTVRHANLQNGTDPTFQTIADRHIFQLDVNVTRIVPMHLGRPQTKVVQMSDTATLRTFQ